MGIFAESRGIRNEDFFEEVTADQNWQKVEFISQKVGSDDDAFHALAIRVRNTGANNIDVAFNEQDPPEKSDIVQAGEETEWRPRYENFVQVRTEDGADVTSTVEVIAW